MHVAGTLSNSSCSLPPPSVYFETILFMFCDSLSAALARYYIFSNFEEWLLWEVASRLCCSGLVSRRNECGLIKV